MDDTIRKLRNVYSVQRGHARYRGIPFVLTFDEWKAIWEESGHLSERGRNRDQYVMARIGDRGPYAVGNVKIITFVENVSEQVFSPETREKLAAVNRGKVLSAETKAKVSAAQKAIVGRIFSEEHKARMSASARRRWAERRAR
jgi:hypothetical protein